MENNSLLEALKNIAINCATFEEAEKVLSLFDTLGMKWWNGTECYHNLYETWHRFEDKTCYVLDGEKLGCDDLECCKEQDYTVQPAQWFLYEFTPKEDNTVISKVQTAYDELSTYKEFINYLDKQAIGDMKSNIQRFNEDGENIFHGYIKASKEIKDNSIILALNYEKKYYEAKWMPIYNNANMIFETDENDNISFLVLLPTKNEEKYFLIEYKRKLNQILIM